MNEKDNLLNTIIELELKLSSKETRSNKDVIENLLDEEFFEFGVSGGFLKRKEIVQYLLKFGSSDESESFEFEGKLLSKDIYLLTYKAEQIKENNIVKSLRSSIWSKSTGSWKMVFHQATKQKD